MHDDLLYWVAIGMATLGIPMFLFGLIRHRRVQRVALCPGPRRPIFALLWLPGWIWRSGCRYELCALAPTDAGVVRCPECGTRVTPTRMLRIPYRWLAGRSGALMILMATSVLLTIVIRAERWPGLLSKLAVITTEHTPTLALIATKHMPLEQTPWQIRFELADRVHAGEITGWQARALAAATIDDLRDDNVRYNGLDAISTLRQLGAEAKPALLGALRSDDWQQRQLAAHVLHQMQPSPTTDDLIRVSIEGLRADDLPRGTRRTGRRRSTNSYVNNAQLGMHYLIHCDGDIDAHLAQAMQSNDPQQVVLSAAVSGLGRRMKLLDQAAPILVKRLEDNSILGDAAISIPALRSYGKAVLPYLEPFRNSADSQQRIKISIILEELAKPESKWKPMRVRWSS